MVLSAGIRPASLSCSFSTRISNPSKELFFLPETENIERKSPSEESAALQAETPLKQEALENLPEPSKETLFSPADSVSLGKDLEIFPGRPIPEYNNGKLKAYAASGTGALAGKHFALVCERHLVPRTGDAQTYKRIVNNAAVPLIFTGIVKWPPTGGQRLVFIYEDVLGKPLLAPGQPLAMGWKQDAVMERIVQPLISVLEDFANKDFVHGRINPMNMFDGGGKNHIILGECLAAPPFFTQPVLFEPIERGMAQPLARGLGTQQGDLYALGVSLTVFMRTVDPLAGLSDEEIIKQKIIQGSYAALTGKDKFKGSILELLRGLLHDDPKERWSVEEICAWMEGQRLKPRQVLKRKKASRPILFQKHKYYMTPTLAMVLNQNSEEALHLIESGEISLWIQRSLEDKEMHETYENNLATAKDLGKGPGYNDRLITATSATLDPFAPLRYKNFALMSEGMGSLLAKAFALKEDLTPFAEIFSKGVILNWLSGHKSHGVDAGSFYGRFDACRSYVSQTKRAGFGLERCLYFLSSQCPCLSDVVKDYYVRTPEDLLYAFEDLCKEGKTPPFFLDRHSIAFLCAKEFKSIDPFLTELNAAEPYKRILGNLKTLAVLQNRLDLPALPALSQALADMLPTVYERYHDIEIREKLSKSIARYARDGDLNKMARILDNDEVSKKDFSQFKRAMAEYKSLKDEYNRLEASMDNKDTFGKAVGSDVAAVVSSIIAGIVFLFLAIMYFSNKPLTF